MKIDGANGRRCRSTSTGRSIVINADRPRESHALSLSCVRVPGRRDLSTRGILTGASLQVRPAPVCVRARAHLWYYVSRVFHFGHNNVYVAVKVLPRSLTLVTLPHPNLRHDFIAGEHADCV